LARCLIIGCGCRGRSLAASLIERGHLVRGTTRDPDTVGSIADAGAEPVLADPDRVATLVEALDHVTVVCILLGSATGSGEQLAALHGSRLEMLLTKTVDTTARGVVYEAVGTVEAAVLDAGAERVRRYGTRSLAGAELIDADPADFDAWLTAALDAVNRLL
jgi:3-hydroxyisobutyrate dehydrogenase-like beta-hydroxyacid dehydrogenase